MSGALREEALIDAESSVAGDEDEVAVVEPEVGMASELLLAAGYFARLPRRNNDDSGRTPTRDATAFGGARVETHVTAKAGEKGREGKDAVVCRPSPSVT